MRTARPGFTLVEIVIVVLIIGLLAAIAIPRFSRSKENAHVAAMKSDLRNLVTAQEAYHADSAIYAPATSGLTSWHASPGVTVTIDSAGPSAFRASATHVATARTCEVEAGTGRPPDPAPVCT